jgi:hypothetical protein
MDEGSKALMTAIPTVEHVLVLVEPSEKPLDLPTPPVIPQRSIILIRRWRLPQCGAIDVIPKL